MERKRGEKEKKTRCPGGPPARGGGPGWVVGQRKEQRKGFPFAGVGDGRGGAFLLGGGGGPKLSP